jgi:putative acetyltransferase
MTASTPANFTRQVDALLRAVFDTGVEADLVLQLRSRGEMLAEVTLPGPDGIGAYAGLSAMLSPAGWICLAPVAVWPALRSQGLGSRVVQMALDWASARDATLVVLGDPDWYGARGFSQHRARNLKSPYPLDFTLLAGPGADAPFETLVYPAAFDQLG